MAAHIHIIGLGLIGGSLARDLRQKKLCARLTAVSHSPSTIEYALSNKLVDEGSTERLAFANEADIIVLCTPLSLYPEFFAALHAVIKPDAILTDVGSVKTCVELQAKQHLSGKQQSLCVPAHPIAGSEKSGVRASEPGLFEKKRVIITPTETTQKKAYQAVADMWQGVGAKIDSMPASTHDIIYAHVSHLPQLLAFAYRIAFSPEKKDITGPFARFYRIAQSPSAMWCDIFTCNQEALMQAVVMFIKSLQQIVPGMHAKIPLPTLIALALKDIGKDYAGYSGSGFADVTSVATESDYPCQHAIEDLPIFLITLDSLCQALVAGKIASLLPQE